MPEPITVWMVPLRRGEEATEVKGELALTADALVFTGKKDPTPVTIPLPSVRRARRLRGSPVLLLEWGSGTGPARTAFYFSQPPPLTPPEPGTASLAGDAFGERPMGAFGAIRRTSKRRHQKTNIQYLQRVGVSQKTLIRAWAEEIMERREAP